MSGRNGVRYEIRCLWLYQKCETMQTAAWNPWKNPLMTSCSCKHLASFFLGLLLTGSQLEDFPSRVFWMLYKSFQLACNVQNLLRRLCILRDIVHFENSACFCTSTMRGQFTKWVHASAFILLCSCRLSINAHKNYERKCVPDDWHSFSVNDLHFSSFLNGLSNLMRKQHFSLKKLLMKAKVIFFFIQHVFQ